jgi:hypothetical protein
MYLAGSVELNRVSRNLDLGQGYFQGTYQDGGKGPEVQVYSSGSEAWTLSGNIPSLGISNEYSLTFDLTGVGAVRALSLDDYFQKKEQDEISAFVISVTQNKKPSLLIIKANSEGSPSPVAILNKK